MKRANWGGTGNDSDWVLKTLELSNQQTHPVKAQQLVPLSYVFWFS